MALERLQKTSGSVGVVDSTDCEAGCSFGGSGGCLGPRLGHMAPMLGAVNNGGHVDEAQFPKGWGGVGVAAAHVLLQSMCTPPLPS